MSALHSSAPATAQIAGKYHDGLNQKNRRWLAVCAEVLPLLDAAPIAAHNQIFEEQASLHDVGPKMLRRWTRNARDLLRLRHFFDLQDGCEVFDTYESLRLLQAVDFSRAIDEALAVFTQERGARDLVANIALYHAQARRDPHAIGATPLHLLMAMAAANLNLLQKDWPQGAVLTAPLSYMGLRSGVDAELVSPGPSVVAGRLRPMAAALLVSPRFSMAAQMGAAIEDLMTSVWKAALLYDRLILILCNAEELHAWDDLRRETPEIFAHVSLLLPEEVAATLIQLGRVQSPMALAVEGQDQDHNLDYDEDPDQSLTMDKAQDQRRDEPSGDRDAGLLAEDAMTNPAAGTGTLLLEEMAVSAAKQAAAALPA